MGCSPLEIPFMGQVQNHCSRKWALSEACQGSRLIRNEDQYADFLKEADFSARCVLQSK